MPLRFGDMGMFINDFKPNFRSDLPHGLINSNLQRKHDAKQNELAVEANRSAATAKAGSEMQIKQMGIDADKAKVADENRKKFMERLTNAARSGDDGQLAAVANEAKQYGLELKHEKRGAVTTPDILGGGEIQLPAKDVFRVRDIQTGEENIFDMDKQRDTNRDRTSKVYGMAMKNARPQDQDAHRQAMDAVLISGQPLDQAIKLNPLDSTTHRLDREGSELRQRLALAEAKIYHRDSLEQRGQEHRDKMTQAEREHADRMAVLKGQEERKNEEAAKRQDRADRQHERAMYTQAIKTGSSPTIAIEDKNKILKSAIKIQDMLDDVTSVPGATPGKAQIAAVREFGIMMQDGFNRLTDADAKAAGDSWGVVNSVINKISQGLGDGLADQELRDFDEAISRIIVTTENQRKDAFKSMSKSLPRNDEIGMEQYGRYMNTHFGDSEWFENAAKETGVPLFSGEATPAPEPAAPVQAVSDDEMERMLQEEGL